MKEDQAIERLRQVLRRQHKALATEDSYVLWLRRYIKALAKIPQELPSEKKLEIFLTDLAQVHDVSASTQNQAFHAIVYFYKEALGQPLGNVKSFRATRPAHERHAPTVAETQALLQAVPNQGGYPTNLVARMLYGCGMRVSEPLNLRIKDIDLERRRFCIRGAKGGKDRVVAIPLSLIPELTQQMQLARVVWERDKHNGMPVMLPHTLARKYPEYQFSWGWAWLFPAHQPCRDPRSERIVRYRMHEVNVQRAVKQAARRLGICALPHELRHSFASHSLERGANPRAIQEVMGHTSLETTMGYMHAEALSVPSPLDALPLIVPTPEVRPMLRVEKVVIAPDLKDQNPTASKPIHLKVSLSPALPNRLPKTTVPPTAPVKPAMRFSVPSAPTPKPSQSDRECDWHTAKPCTSREFPPNSQAKVSGARPFMPERVTEPRRVVVAPDLKDQNPTASKPIHLKGWRTESSGVANKPGSVTDAPSKCALPPGRFAPQSANLQIKVLAMSNYQNTGPRPAKAAWATPPLAPIVVGYSPNPGGQSKFPAYSS